MDAQIKAALTTANDLNLRATSRSGMIQLLGVTVDPETAVYVLTLARREGHTPTAQDLQRAQQHGPRFEHPICSRCGGSGYIHAYRYVANGVCFRCDGHGSILDASAHHA